ncbi:MAG: hypothetical protein ACJAQ3_003355 [Planctomycetota bacterium]|jgi:hypothetical protein
MPSRTTRHAVLALVVTASLLVVAWIWTSGPSAETKQVLTAAPAPDGSASELAEPGPEDAQAASLPLREHLEPGVAAVSAAPAAKEISAAQGIPAEPELPAEHVRVRVLKSTGEPAADVAVSLRYKHFLRDPHTIVTTFTDAKGEVVLHGRKLTQIITSRDGPFSRPSLSVFPEIPMTAEVSVAVALPLDTDAVYELVLPALGSVTVNVLGPDGEPFLESCRVGARWVPTIEVGTEVYGGYNRCHDRNRVTTTGTSRYEFVGSDVSMTLHATADAFGIGSLVNAPITVGPGENQEVTVQLGPMRPVVRCQVLGVNGAPVANEEMQARVWHSPESKRKRPFSNPFKVQTGDDGRVEFFFDRELDADYPRRLYLERTAGGHENRPGPDWSRVDLALPLRLSTSLEHDLGTGRLVAPELLQEGFVYDFRGEPASSVRVTFVLTDPGRPNNRSQSDYIGVVYTENDGHFVFRAFDRPAGMWAALYGHVKIDGSMRRVYGEHRELGLGDRSAIFFLEAPPESSDKPVGTLPVSTSYDPDLPGEYFAVQFIQGRSKQEAIPLSFLKGTPQMLTLEPGTWALRVFLYGLDHDLILVEGLEIKAGETLVDSRCMPLDLRGLATRVRFPVQRPGGAPWRGKNLRIRVAQPPIAGKVRAGEDGFLDFALPAGCSGLELSPNGEIWTRVDPKMKDTVTLAES